MASFISTKDTNKSIFAVESLPEGPTQEKLINKLWDAYILYTKDLVSFEELREILYNIPMEGSKKRRSAQKKHRDHNKLPKMFKDSKVYIITLKT